MNELRNIRRQLLAGFILAALIPHLPVLFTMFYHQLTGAPTAVQANISLPRDYSGRRTILDGEWEFYWDRLLITQPQPDARPDLLIQVPGYWSSHKISGSYLPANGCASYRLMLEDLDSTQPVTVYVPDFGSAYQAYIDGRLAAESGIVSENNSAVFTTPSPALYPVTLSEGLEHEIVIETATTRFSGLYKTPVLEGYAQAVQGGVSRNAVRFMLFGMVLFSFLALTAVYFLSYRKEKHSAWLIALITCVLLRLMLVSEFYTFWQKKVFFNLSYESTNELMFLVSFALKFLMIFLYQAQFGLNFSRREKIGFLVYYTAIFLVHCLVPYDFYNRCLTVLLPASSFVMDIYSFCKVYFGSLKLQPYALLIYWGTIIAAGGLIADSYYVNGNIYPNLSLVLLIAITVYMTLLSIAYILLTVDVYRDYETSSARLTLAGNQIAMQAEYYDALSVQINEVRSIRHDIRHFIRTLKSLSDEGRYEELDRFLDKYAGRSDSEPLPVFCENAVANSILGYYSLQLKKSGIAFHCSCSIPKNLSVDDSDLCIVLGNALENAMEACNRLTDPAVRSVSAEARPVNGQLLIKIVNTYDGTLQNKDGNYLTTKNSPYHGMGLKNIQKAADRCGGFVKIEHSKTAFTLMVAFPQQYGGVTQAD